MAIVVIRPWYRPFLNELVFACERTGAPLSARARQLLALAVESWFEDREFEATEPRHLSPMQQRELAREVFKEVLQDSHLEDARRTRRQVSFGSLLAALGDAGRKILRKGFFR